MRCFSKKIENCQVFGTFNLPAVLRVWRILLQDLAILPHLAAIKLFNFA